ncbi:MAG: polysaccharide deacetylase [Chitinophagaceae bacterium]|nr:MAG: polysaccharide deacetylase [Chitinophagaceae bacterium]
MPKRKGQFILSLDFELFWGVRDKRSIENYGENIRGVRQVIPRLLELFDTYGVQATFATVGFLFCRNREELINSLPSVLPAYDNPNYSPYHQNYHTKIGISENEDIYHFGYSLLKAIQQTSRHEIGTHTFSHFYCLEGASFQSFEADLMAAKRIAALNDIELKSIVFPRNQYSAEHIAICKRLGILTYRGNEAASIYQPMKNKEISKTIRLTKLLDTYINITGYNTHNLFLQADEGTFNVPASAFLRPYNKRLAPLIPLQVIRIKKSMLHAAQTGEAFHLWWHPHNFGVYLKENIKVLEGILQYYRHLQQEYGIASYTMAAIAKEIKQQYAK